MFEAGVQGWAKIVHIWSIPNTQKAVTYTERKRLCQSKRVEDKFLFYLGILGTEINHEAFICLISGGRFGLDQVKHQEVFCHDWKLSFPWFTGGQDKHVAWQTIWTYGKIQLWGSGYLLAFYSSLGSLDSNCTCSVGTLKGGRFLYNNRGKWKASGTDSITWGCKAYLQSYFNVILFSLKL